MALTKEQLQERAQLIRIYEAACAIAHPEDEDKRFRTAVMRELGLKYGLREMRNWTVGVPPEKSAAAAAAKPAVQPPKPNQTPRRD